MKDLTAKRRHIWPWQKNQEFPWPSIEWFRSEDPLMLDSQSWLPSYEIAYETWGEPSGQPVVVFHALTGDSHVAPHDGEDRPGWWDGVLGSGRALDPDTHYILCHNVLGGAMGSTGPSSWDPEGRPWGSRFPQLSLFDMVRAADRWIQSLVGLRPVILVGGSMGGMLAYAYGALYPERVKGILAIGAPIRHEPWAISYHTVGRTAIWSDPAFRGGDYYDGPFPDQGLALARMADMISYQHPASMDQKFSRKRQTADGMEFQIESYLRYQGQKLVRRFDANTYITLTQAMDQFELSSQAIRRLAAIPVWVAGITSDMLYPPAEIERHVALLREQQVSVMLEWLDGPWGHDTFLVDQNQTNGLVQRFLAAVE